MIFRISSVHLAQLQMVLQRYVYCNQVSSDKKRIQYSVSNRGYFDTFCLIQRCCQLSLHGVYKVHICFVIVRGLRKFCSASRW